MLTKSMCPALLGGLFILFAGFAGCSSETSVYVEKPTAGGATASAGNTLVAGSPSSSSAGGTRSSAQAGASNGSTVQAGAAAVQGGMSATSLQGNSGALAHVGGSGGVNVNQGGANQGGATVGSTLTAAGMGGRAVENYGGSWALSSGGIVGYAGAGATESAGAAGATVALTTIRAWEFSTPGDLEGWKLSGAVPLLGANAQQTNFGANCSASGCALVTTTFSVTAGSYETFIFNVELPSPLDLSSATLIANLTTSATGFRVARMSVCSDNGPCASGCGVSRNVLAKGGVLRMRLPATKSTTGMSGSDDFCWITAEFDPARVTSVWIVAEGGTVDPGAASFWIDSVRLAR